MKIRGRAKENLLSWLCELVYIGQLSQNGYLYKTVLLEDGQLMLVLARRFSVISLYVNSL